MSSEQSPIHSEGHECSRFDTTHWSVVLAAGREPSADSDAALEFLCQAYWYPLYSYVRRRVPDVNEAQDLTQEFFALLLEKEYLADARPERGRFRAFLLTSFSHFLSKQWDKQRAQKRGGRIDKLSLDFNDGEARYQMEPMHELTPQRLYLRKWAVTLTNRVLASLRDECKAKGKSEQFDVLKSSMSLSSEGKSYADAAATLRVSEGAVRVAVHRLRRRYVELLRAEIANTVERPEDIEEEIQALFAAFN